MCGITGIVEPDTTGLIDRARLVRMRDVMVHRGPDGEGLYIAPGVGLAHRRLAVIDVASGAQPMSNEDATVWIVYNGEVYNHASLRTWLEARGHRYRSRSDTETILHLYEELGEQVVERLEGMFAFAIWDNRQKRLLLARDRLGIKPLYYARVGRGLVFGSEIKALLQSGVIRPEFNESTLPEFLGSGFVSGTETFFAGVHKLMPGHTLRWDAGDGIVLRRYWQVPHPEPSLGANAGATAIRRELELAVKRHLMSDVPLGVFLSGGIDSSVLATLVTRLRGEPASTFAVGFADRDTSELPYARLAAEHAGATHREITLAPEDFFRVLPQLVWHEDEPLAFPSSVPLYFLARHASEHVKVVLTGEGADELFLGYNRYRIAHWNMRLGRLYRATTPSVLRMLTRQAIDYLPARVAALARRTFLAVEPHVHASYFENFSVLDNARQRRLLNDHHEWTDPYAAHMGTFDEGIGSVLDRISQSDLRTYLVELLMKQDQMSMAASIESRVPYLDDRLVAHVGSIPASTRLPGWHTKILLRAAVRDLVPRQILSRRKMGFPVPLAAWLRGPYRTVVDDLVLGPRAVARGLFDRTTLTHLVSEQRATGGFTHAIWLLLNLEIWLRLYRDGEAVGDIMREPLCHRQHTAYANPLGKSGRALARDDRRPRPQPTDAVGALSLPLGDARHDAR